MFWDLHHCVESPQWTGRPSKLDRFSNDTVNGGRESRDCVAAESHFFGDYGSRVGIEINLKNLSSSKSINLST